MTLQCRLLKRCSRLLTCRQFSEGVLTGGELLILLLLLRLTWGGLLLLIFRRRHGHVEFRLLMLLRGRSSRCWLENGARLLLWHERHLLFEGHCLWIGIGRYELHLLICSSILRRSSLVWLKGGIANTRLLWWCCHELIRCVRCLWLELMMGRRPVAWVKHSRVRRHIESRRWL